MRAIASPAIPTQFHAIPHNSAQFRAIRGQLLAIPRNGILIGNPVSDQE